jgi:hypothetical protein
MNYTIEEGGRDTEDAYPDKSMQVSTKFTTSDENSDARGARRVLNREQAEEREGDAVAVRGSSGACFVLERQGFSDVLFEPTVKHSGSRNELNERNASRWNSAFLAKPLTGISSASTAKITKLWRRGLIQPKLRPSRSRQLRKTCPTTRSLVDTC